MTPGLRRASPTERFEKEAQVLDVRQFFTYQASRYGGKRHASRGLETHTLCDRVVAASFDPKATNAPATVRELFAEVTCLACTQLLLNEAGVECVERVVSSVPELTHAERLDRAANG